MNIYRFYDHVAVTPPKGDTFYLTTTEATKVASALLAASIDVHEGPFTLSEFKPKSIETSGEIR